MKKKDHDAIRLDRLLSALALGTRTQVQNLIRSGRITVNQKAVFKPESHVNASDAVALDGQALDTRLSRHIMLNKPCGVLTAARDPRQPTVIDLLPPIFESLGCMPVGRLDKDTEGLLLLTTDGTLAHQILSPRRQVWKTYRAVVDGPLSGEDVLAFERGLALSDFTALPARLTILRSSGTEAEALVDVCEGKYHQVRRMFEARGRIVTALKRLAIGPISLDESLAVGEYRELTEAELRAIRQAVSGEKYAE